MVGAHFGAEDAYVVVEADLAAEISALRSGVCAG
jgi:hypothetical protein